MKAQVFAQCPPYPHAHKKYSSRDGSRMDSGEYWVRRMRQLPRAPLKIPHVVHFALYAF